MRNIFSKILISFFMLGIFLVPISANLNLQNALSPSVEIQTNTAEAWWGPGVSAAAIWNSLVKPIGEGIGWTVAQVIKAFLFLVFQALALLASILADILDFFIFYSIGSDVYRSTFVEAAWGTVRDVANIFFLLGLLYVAIQIVLDIGVSEKKKMIGNIIVMALLVNFSLFATQVVIDASNIVARVFYNQIESVDSTGKKLPEGKYLPKSVTVSLVSTFDPNKIISDQSSVYMDVLAYLIMVGIVGYMCYLFLVMTFLFVGRIVSLWVAMIFGPIAFMSRALGITALEDLSWKNWLHNLINSAMMAPLFIFFLYIILLLGKWIETLKKDVVVFSGQGDPFLAFISVLIPMAIIFTLLTKAKSLAIKYSGDIGKSLSSVGPALAGLALGGGALVGGFAARNTIGTAAKYAKDDERRGEDSKNVRTKAWSQFKKFEISKGIGTLRKGAIAKAVEAGTGTERNAAGAIIGRNAIGRNIYQAKYDYTDKKDAQDTIKSKIEKMSEKLHISKDSKFDTLTDTQKKKITDSINMDSVSKKMYKGRNFDELNEREKTTVRDARIDEQADGSIGFVGADTKGRTYGQIDANGNIISREMTTGGKQITKKASESTTIYTIAGEGLDSAAKGSWDIRNISKASSRELKTMVALLAGIAVLLRGGLKKGSVDPGVGQKDFFKDLTEVITGTMKNVGAGVAASVTKDAAHKVGEGHDDHGHGGGGGGHH